MDIKRTPGLSFAIGEEVSGSCRSKPSTTHQILLFQKGLRVGSDHM